MRVRGWGRHKLWQPCRLPGVFSRVCPIVQSLRITLGLITRGKKLTCECEGRVKRLTATCEKISPLVNFEFTWSWNLSLDFSIRIDCWVFWVSFDELLCRAHWLFCMADLLTPTALLQVHDWLPQKLAPLCPKWLELTCQHGLTFGLNKF